jgi:hypothetical protein
MDLALTGTPADFDELPEQDVELQPSGLTETAYLQPVGRSAGAAGSRSMRCSATWPAW